VIPGRMCACMCLCAYCTRTYMCVFLCVHMYVCVSGYKIHGQVINKMERERMYVSVSGCVYIGTNRIENSA
jgi:hypothetical protein